MRIRHNKILLFFIFLIINFGCLGLGTILMNNGPQTDWYLFLNKAPWTPPGWFFGFAWSTIMLCFSIYLVPFLNENQTREKYIFYVIQIVLNVIWNYVFFNLQNILLGLVVIISLTFLIFYFFFCFKKELKNYSYLLTPYMLWLCVATSLNLYILIYN